MKTSYTVPCASEFRDRIAALTARRGVNAADVARSVLLLLPPEVIEARADPGEPDKDDRETVILKSGPAAGRPWRRKPRLQMRLRPGLGVATIRKALAIAFDLDHGGLELRLDGARSHVDDDRLKGLRDENDRLRALVSVLSFDPLPSGVRNREEALFVLGFPPGRSPERASLRARFRVLATIHHPDSPYGNHRRMSQINSAADLLLRGG